jgi:hypothetical protein
MEGYFTPSRRLQDRYGVTRAGYTEVELAIPIEELMSQPWDYSAFRAFATTGVMRKILWIAEDTFISFEGPNAGFTWRSLNDHGRVCLIQRATCTVTSGERHTLVLVHIANSASLVAGAACSVFWRVVTTSNCVKLKLANTQREFGLCSGPALSQLLDASPLLRLLELEDFAFKENDCLVLATLNRTGLKVTFHECSFDTERAEESFVEWLRNSQVVTELEHCRMDDGIISALSGNSSIKSLTISGDDAIIRSLAGALSGNQGIENLQVDMTEEASCLLLRSLWAHPRIQSVLLFTDELSAASKANMMNALLQLAQCNTVVRTIQLVPDHAMDDALFQNSILPRLEMNRNCFQEQRQALTRAMPFVASFSDEHCTSSVTIPISCFDFSRRMSQLLFDRTRKVLLFRLSRSERHGFDAAPAST